MKFAEAKTLLKTITATVVLLLMSIGAQANVIPASWTETIDFNPHVSIPPAHTYSHDLTNDGFTPFADLILGYDLIVNLVDDARDGWEFAIVDLPGFAGDRHYFNVRGTEGGGMSLMGFLELNILGTLTVTIDSFWGVGDFELASSTLNAQGVSYSAVPEPGTLGLLGAALLGLAWMRRRGTGSTHTG